MYQKHDQVVSMDMGKDVILEILSMKSSPGGRSSKEELLDVLQCEMVALRKKKKIKSALPHQNSGAGDHQKVS